MFLQQTNFGGVYRENDDGDFNSGFGFITDKDYIFTEETVR